MFSGEVIKKLALSELVGLSQNSKKSLIENLHQAQIFRSEYLDYHELTPHELSQVFQHMSHIKGYEISPLLESLSLEQIDLMLSSPKNLRMLLL